ncbi:MAG: glycoside hydrolase family 2 protein [Bacteroidales bacterium]|nr:MAG: glycoside hydrolase family 2 protein [Bacteroidales bacterium]
MKNLSFILLLLVLFVSCGQYSSELDWPRIDQQTKPWTRWWWMGNAVNKNELTAVLEEYKKAGLGGIEITPIYGVKGYEDKFINYLSQEWVDMLIHTLEESKRLDLGVDMATGTGWPFGGPWVSEDNACKNVACNTYILKEGEELKEPVRYIQAPLVRSVRSSVDISELAEPVSGNKKLQELALDQVRFEKPLPLVVLMAYSDKGEILELTEKVNSSRKLNWKAPAGSWKLYAVFQGWHGKMVERAAPGGETNVIDHFSENALSNYLQKFDNAFENRDIKSLRAFFNDSYEVDDAYGQSDWTPDYFNEFKGRRGYDLRNHLPALFANDPTEKNMRILCDYRETISELLLEEFTIPWTEWVNRKKAITRNQAHGSPANILDLYAASDIPETEGTNILGIKFASSAANVSGKQLISAESATWLDEHFMASLGAVKKAVDLYLLGGVNHIIYHGTTYSPQNEIWPGWMFYASVHFGPTNTFWNDFAALNEYVACCQSFLQNGKPDNDILLYYPFHDRISQPGRGMLEHFNARGPGFNNSEFALTAKELVEKGYSLDYISDSQIMNLNFKNDSIHSNKTSYKAIVLPKCNYIPVETFIKLYMLAKDGATVILHKNLPADVPGFGKLEKRRKEFTELVNSINFTRVEESEILKATAGKGTFLTGDNLDILLSYAGIERESIADKGLQVIRRKLGQSRIYFIVNRGETTIDEWIPLQKGTESIAFYNPVNRKKGIAATRTFKNGENEIYLQLEPGESCILKTLTESIEAPRYKYVKIQGEPQVINGEWTINFIEGGPVLHEEIKTKKLDSWTTFTGDDLKSFSGTAKYMISFTRPDDTASYWLLDMGSVHESAVLILNGEKLATLFTAPYRIIIPYEILKTNNILEVKVSNLMANRIAYLEREGYEWKKFYNINFPARKRENTGSDGLFNASNWPPQISGLIGPVTITPVKILEF